MEIMIGEICEIRGVIKKAYKDNCLACLLKNVNIRFN